MTSSRDNFTLKNQYWKANLSQRDHQARIFLPELLNKGKATPTNAGKTPKHVALSPNSSMISLNSMLGRISQDTIQMSPKKESKDYTFRRTMSQTMISSLVNSAQSKKIHTTIPF